MNFFLYGSSNLGSYQFQNQEIMNLPSLLHIFLATHTPQYFSNLIGHTATTNDFQTFYIRIIKALLLG
jgi:hypothetical protein